MDLAYQQLDDGTSITITALDEGAWGNVLWLKLYGFDDTEEHYTLDVYQAQGGHLLERERWQVSNGYQLDGYGRQLHAETRINGKSEYIDVTINQHASAPSMPRHTVVSETVLFQGTLAKVANTNQHDVIPGSVRITVNTPGNFLIVDDKKGNLSGPGGVGFIDYVTGDYTIAFAFGNAGTATYGFTTLIALAGGTDGEEPTVDDYITALDIFRDKNDIAFEFLIEAAYRTDAYQTALVSLCQSRKDCIAFLSVPVFDDFRDLILWRTKSGIDTSYALLFAPAVQIKEDGSLVNTFAPAHVASVYVDATDKNGPWSAVAGIENSGIECIGTSERYTEPELLELIENQINPIVPHYAHGAFIYSQRTAIKRGTVEQEAHVRRAAIYIRAAIVRYLRSKNFKLNTVDLRDTVTKQISQFLAIIQSNGGLVNYRVICDTSNNTNVIINARELRVDAFVTLPDVLEGIHITSVADGRDVRSTVEFVG